MYKYNPEHFRTEDEKGEYITRENVKKAIKHEKSFSYKEEDLIKKRMDSDLFKGGLR